MSPLSLMLDLMNRYDKGRLHLPAGSYAIHIKTHRPPVQVMTGEHTTGAIPVCHGNVNRYGVALLPDGFMLYAEVVTEFTELEWHATLDHAHANHRHSGLV